MRQLFARLTTTAGITAALATALAGFSPAATAQQLKTVAAVDLPRYMGRWHEIARLPNSFQKQCVSSVTADYRILADHKIEVANRCKTADGEIDLAVGEARTVDGGNAKLQVRFAPSWLSWIPMVWGDYWIVSLNQDYSVATVGSPDREYLWILARTPTLTPAEYENQVDIATKRGFDTARLIKTRQ